MVAKIFFVVVGEGGLFKGCQWEVGPAKPRKLILRCNVIWTQLEKYKGERIGLIVKPIQPNSIQTNN